MAEQPTAETATEAPRDIVCPATPPEEVLAPVIPSVGQRIDAVLALLIPADGEAVREAISQLCARILSEATGL